MRFITGMQKSAFPGIAITAVLSILILSACAKSDAPDPRNLTTMVSVEGSDTMTDLVKKLAETFMKQNENVPVSVSGDDSGRGIQALLNKTTDLAAASRDLTPEEEKLAHQKRIHLRRVTIARDSIAIIVNERNPVNQMTMEQLRKIYSGEFKRWRDVGGEDKPIELCMREPASGTSSYFREHVLAGGEYAASARSFNSHEAVTHEVAARPSAIGYVGMGSATASGAKVKSIDLKLTAASSGVEATPVSTTGDYPLSRPLFFFLERQSKESVQKFVDFCLSEDGQKLVVSSGFVKVGQDDTPATN